MRLAIWQTTSPAGEVEAGFAALAPMLAAAAASGATMLVGPEAFLPGYNCDSIAAQAQPRGGPWHTRLSDLCRQTGCGLTLGYAERDGDRIYNSAVTFDAAGREMAHYRKIQLYGTREKAIYTPGDAYTVFDLAGVRTALLICYDMEFAPHIVALAAKGVHLILGPTASMQPFSYVVRHAVPALAAHHGLTIAYANFCGAEGDLDYLGGSQIADPYGDTLVQAGHGPALLIADLPMTRDPDRLSTQATDFRKIGHA